MLETPSKTQWSVIERAVQGAGMGLRRGLLQDLSQLEPGQIDFMEVAPNKKFKRLSIGQEVRLRHAYFIRCNEVIKDDNGEVIELRCTYDPATKSGSGFNERKPKGTIHWVSATESKQCIFRVYDDLFLDYPDDKHLIESVNPLSEMIFENAYLEAPAYEFVKEGDKRFQFIRNGYYTVDQILTEADTLVFNQIVPLKSTFKKIVKDQ